MTQHLATPGTLLKGRHVSNPDARAKVWMIHPTNPHRVLLWMKTGRFSWNNVSSLAVNYEPAPAGEPTWPDPTREPPQDTPRGRKEQTPVEAIAEKADGPEEDDAGPAAGGEVTDAHVPAPPPTTAAAASPSLSDELSVHVTLRGPTAQTFSRQLAILNNAAALTGGSPMTADDLVSKAVDRLVSQVMGGAL